MSHLRAVLRALALTATVLLLPACGPRINESPEVFFPPEMSGPMRELQAFPGVWWNYVVAPRPTKELCDALKAEPSLRRVGCHYGPDDLKHLLAPWQEDLPLRVPPPSKEELLDKMNLALAKASAPIGPDITDVLRADPLGTYEDLLALLQRLSPLRLDYRNGFLRFPESDAAAIPLLLDFPREQTDSTEALRARVEAACGGKCGELFFIGPHFGTAHNKGVVKSDLKRVTIAGAILFALFLGFLAATGRWRALLMAVPVAFGIWCAGLVVGWAGDGSIHGLTIAFGSGLAGIALDYALHAFVQSSGPKVWLANILGYLTTAVVFVVLWFSGIPLVKELMLFGMVGMTIAFVLFALVLPKLPEKHYLKPFPVGPVETKLAPWFLGICVLALVAAGIFLRPDFSMQSLDQASERERKVTSELFRAAGGQGPLARLHREVSEEELKKERIFAESNGITLVNRLTFLPLKAEQERNLAGWKKLACAKAPRGKKAGLEGQFTETYQRFFAPFFARVSCEKVSELAPKETSEYARAIEADGRWLSTFFPRSEEDAKALKERFPDAFSPRELVELFPRRISREMAWMAPLALALMLLIVLLAYRRPAFVIATLIPWLAGAAFTVPALAWSPSGFGFVSLVGQLMVFGMAVDYGIFCVNYYVNYQPGRRGIWTAIVFSGVVTLTGFVPLLFAEHVVLRQLGETLCLGTLGTVFGTFLIEPWWMKRALRA